MNKVSIFTILGTCLTILLAVTSCSTASPRPLPTSTSATTSLPPYLSQMQLASQYGTHSLGAPFDPSISSSIENVASTLGRPLTSEEITAIQDDRSLSPDGIFLNAYYSQPISLRTTDGNLLASVKYISIRWDSGDGKPNLLLYSTDSKGLFGANAKDIYSQTIEGGFQIEGSITALEQSVGTLVPGGVNDTLTAAAP